MKISKAKLDIALARNCKSLSYLRGHGLSPQTLARARHGAEVKPTTLGKIAKALGVDPADLLEDEKA